MDQPFTRQIHGFHNARDLGGFRVPGGITRKRVLVRSEAPVDIGSAGKATLSVLGLQTAIDLRDEIERRASPLSFGGLEIDVRSVPLFSGPEVVQQTRGLSELNRLVLEHSSRRFKEIVEILSCPGALPAIVFCNAGKDRTGLVCAVLLSALGVADSDVAADYALSDKALHGEFRASVLARAHATGLVRQVASADELEPTEIMKGVLSDLESKWGGATGYLLRHGVSQNSLMSLRRDLVESDTNSLSRWE